LQFLLNFTKACFADKIMLNLIDTCLIEFNFVKIIEG